MNIQNLPRKEKVVKRAFIPKLDSLLFADYDQIEMRVLAYYMAQLGDNSMRDVLADASTDLHKESAKGIFMLDREPTDAERQLGKNMNFSMSYGGGKPAVMKYLAEFNSDAGTNVPVTWKYAQLVLDNFHARWPGIGRVVSALEVTYRNRGDLRTVAGARLHPQKQNAMLNSVVQSSAAEVMREALRRCHRELRDKESHLVCVIHDELVFDVYEPEKEELVAMLPVWMDYPSIGEFVPVTISLEHSYTNWADKEPLGV